MERTETEVQADLLRTMPKAELHLHLDGSLRLDTIAELAEQHGIVLPVSRDELPEACRAPEDCTDLVQFLSRFAIPLEVLQTSDALERAIYELCEDVYAEGVRYVEIRFAPVLHRDRGMGLEEIISAVVQGWWRGKREFGLAGGIILCGMRHLPPDATMAVARAGLRFLGAGVIGFDIAGDEAGYSILLHREPLLWAKEAGYGMTAHAGEAAGAESVRDAVEVIGVSRVGHGVRSGEEPQLLDTLRDLRVALEMCPKSNQQTKAVPSLAHHPLARYYHHGVPVTVSTDNRTVADTTLTHDLFLSHEHMGLSIADLAAMNLLAVEVGFAEEAERAAVRAAMHDDMIALGILPADRPASLSAT